MGHIWYSPNVVLFAAHDYPYLYTYQQHVFSPLIVSVDEKFPETTISDNLRIDFIPAHEMHVQITEFY